MTEGDMVDLAAQGRGRFFIDQARPKVVRFQFYDDRSADHSIPFSTAEEARKWLSEHQP